MNISIAFVHGVEHQGSTHKTRWWLVEELWQLFTEVSLLNALEQTTGKISDQRPNSHSDYALENMGFGSANLNFIVESRLQCDQCEIRTAWGVALMEVNIRYQRKYDEYGR